MLTMKTAGALCAILMAGAGVFFDVDETGKLGIFTGEGSAAKTPAGCEAR